MKKYFSRVTTTLAVVGGLIFVGVLARIACFLLILGWRAADVSIHRMVG